MPLINAPYPYNTINQSTIATQCYRSTYQYYTMPSTSGTMVIRCHWLTHRSLTMPLTNHTMAIQCHQSTYHCNIIPNGTIPNILFHRSTHHSRTVPMTNGAMATLISQSRARKQPHGRTARPARGSRRYWRSSGGPPRGWCKPPFACCRRAMASRD